MANKILLVGNGGHCKSIIDTLLSNNIYDEIAIISKENREINYFGIKCIGSDKDLQKLYENGWENAFVSVGSIGNANNRERLFNDLINIGFCVPNIIDRTSIVSDNCKIGRGNFVGKNATINAGTIIGDCCIINTGSIIEHDCTIGNYVHISSNSTLCGNVVVKNSAHVGAGSIIKQEVRIGANTTIGIGSVVTKNIEENVIAYGSPCKVVNKK